MSEIVLQVAAKNATLHGLTYFLCLKTKRPSLKKLAKEILSLSIQSGEHSSVSTCTPNN